MASDWGESTSQQPQNSTWSSSDGNNIDAGDFECNICFDLAQDPIVTLCGHLFCWPCLYRWLHHHSHSQECPVCKALIQEEKLVPLYGRGKTTSDPRSRPIPGMEIPNRPAGHRPETAPPPEANHFMHHAFGSMGGLLPTASARIGNIVISAAFGGLFPSLFNIQVHNVPGAAAMYGGPPDHFHGYHNNFHGRHAHGGFTQPIPHHDRQQRQDDNFKYILFIVGFFVILFLIY